MSKHTTTVANAGAVKQKPQQEAKHHTVSPDTNSLCRTVTEGNKTHAHNGVLSGRWTVRGEKGCIWSIEAIYRDD